MSSGDVQPSECITTEQLVYVKQRWNSMYDQTCLWQWKLVSSLPGDLGLVGDWLCHAERQLQAVLASADDTPAAAVKGIQQQLADISVR